mmetsp:Transcript_1762/g.3492  ORF Transcript_1762/g.3492 Transcript_1762/m.3492 type:complete len:226 (-) Transcript_1762:87-764(-)
MSTAAVYSKSNCRSLSRFRSSSSKSSFCVSSSLVNRSFFVCNKQINKGSSVVDRDFLHKGGKVSVFLQIGPSRRKRRAFGSSTIVVIIVIAWCLGSPMTSTSTRDTKELSNAVARAAKTVAALREAVKFRLEPFPTFFVFELFHEFVASVFGIEIGEFSFQSFNRRLQFFLGHGPVLASAVIPNAGAIANDPKENAHAANHKSKEGRHHVVVAVVVQVAQKGHGE